MGVAELVRVFGSQLVNEYFDLVTGAVPFEVAGFNVADLAVMGLGTATSLGVFSTGKPEIDAFLAIVGLGRLAKEIKERTTGAPAPAAARLTVTRAAPTTKTAAPTPRAGVKVI